MKKRASFTRAARVAGGNPTKAQVSAFAWQLLCKMQGSDFAYGIRRLSSGVALKGRNVAAKRAKDGPFDVMTRGNPCYSVTWGLTVLTPMDRLPIHMLPMASAPSGLSVMVI